MSTTHTAAPAQLPIETGAAAASQSARCSRRSRAATTCPGRSARGGSSSSLLDVDTRARLYPSTRRPSYITTSSPRGPSAGDRTSTRNLLPDGRWNLAGTIVAQTTSCRRRGPRALRAGVLAHRPGRARRVALAFELSAPRAFRRGKLAYHPAGDTQEALSAGRGRSCAQLGVRSISTRELFASVTYVPLNLGVGFGMLRASTRRRRARPRCATSRCSRRAQRSRPRRRHHHRGAADAALAHQPQGQAERHAQRLHEGRLGPRIAALSARSCARGRAGGLALAPATPEEVEAWLERIRPEPQTPPRDLA